MKTPEFSTNLRGDLAARLRPIAEHYAQIVLDPETSFEPVPAPFLARSFVVQAQKFGPSRPILLYIGAQSGSGQAFVLNGQPAEWNRFVAADGAQVRDEATAAELARVFVRTTRPQNRRYVVVESTDALPWRPNLEDDEQAQRRAQTERLAPLLRPPVAVQRIDGGFDVTLFVVNGANVESLTLVVDAGGQVQTRADTVATDLPFTYTM
jgi:hypothetical protein